MSMRVCRSLLIAWFAIFSVGFAPAAESVSTEPTSRQSLDAVAFRVAQQRGTSPALELEQNAVRDIGFGFRRLELAYRLKDLSPFRTGTIDVRKAFAGYCATLDNGYWNERFANHCESRQGKFWVYVTLTVPQPGSTNRAFYEVLNVFDDKGEPVPSTSPSSKTSIGDPGTPGSDNNYNRGEVEKTIEGRRMTLRGFSYLSKTELAQRTERGIAKAKAFYGQPAAISVVANQTITPSSVKSNSPEKMTAMLRGLDVAAQGLEKGCEANGGVAYRSAVGATPTSIPVDCRTSHRMTHGFAWIDVEHLRICFQIRNNPAECGPSY